MVHGTHLDGKLGQAIVKSLNHSNLRSTTVSAMKSLLSRSQLYEFFEICNYKRLSTMSPVLWYVESIAATKSVHRGCILELFTDNDESG
jgi:hypothetical protein